MAVGRIMSPLKTKNIEDTVEDVERKLWEIMPYRDLKRVSQNLFPEHKVEHQDELPKRKMCDSFHELMIPMNSDNKHWLHHISHDTIFRFGKIFEAIDSLGTIVCVHHLRRGDKRREELDFAIVTAKVYGIGAENHDIKINADLRLSGMMTWVGRTSMEVTVIVEQESKTLFNFKIIMVARHLDTNKSIVVNGLELNTEDEIAVFKMGEDASKNRRLQLSELSLKNTPDVKETSDIHRLLLQTIDPKSINVGARMKSEGSVWMDDAILKTFYLCEAEEANGFAGIFGGTIMNKAYELALMNASLFSGQRPIFLGTDISFFSPAAVGSLLLFSSQVAYTEGSRMQVKVIADVVDLLTNKKQMSNVFYYTFHVPSEVPAVIPRTYEEARDYIAARRQFSVSGRRLPVSKL